MLQRYTIQLKQKKYTHQYRILSTKFDILYHISSDYNLKLVVLLQFSYLSNNHFHPKKKSQQQFSNLPFTSIEFTSLGLTHVYIHVLINLYINISFIDFIHHNYI